MSGPFLSTGSGAARSLQGGRGDRTGFVGSADRKPTSTLGGKTMKTFALFAAALICAGPAAAQQWTPEMVTAQQTCYAEANGIGFSGEKDGYADAYRAAVADCLSRGGRTGRYEGYNPPKQRYHARITANCPANAPVLYRGTLYCR